MSKASLLLVDDDPLIQDLIGGWFCDEFDIVGAHNAAEVKSALQQMPKMPDYALVDLGLPPSPHRPDEGFSVIRMLQSASSNCAIVVVSGQESRRHAQRARALGAGEYVEKPCTPEVLREKLLSCRRMLEAARDNLGLVGESAPMRRLRADIMKIAPASFPVLISGETGSGKELVAHALHDNGRAGRPFLPVNCAAIPDHLAEPALFGHVKGAFTGAQTASAGMLGDAEDGTLFLDEIGDLSLQTQGKLLRAIETGEYSRVGETAHRQCTARIVAATNRQVADDGFRRDLYHRISAFILHTPSLREMNGDRVLLLEHFRRRVSADMHTPPFALSEEAAALWDQYRFPGNARELRNIVARLQVKHAGTTVHADDLKSEFAIDHVKDGLLDAADAFREIGAGGLTSSVQAPDGKQMSLDDIARALVAHGKPLASALKELDVKIRQQVLAACGGDRKKSAKMLAISEQELEALMASSNHSPAKDRH